MRSIAAPRDWTIAQHFAIWLGLLTTAVGVIGLAINPDFAVGDEATAETFLGVDWNGWHGVAAILVGVPGLIVAWPAYAGLAVPYLLYRAVTDAGVALWAALDDRPLGLLYLPTSGDVVFHVVVAAVAALAVVLSGWTPAKRFAGS